MRVRSGSIRWIEREGGRLIRLEVQNLIPSEGQKLIQWEEMERRMTSRMKGLRREKDREDAESDGDGRKQQSSSDPTFEEVPE